MKCGRTLAYCSMLGQMECARDAASQLPYQAVLGLRERAHTGNADGRAGNTTWTISGGVAEEFMAAIRRNTGTKHMGYVPENQAEIEGRPKMTNPLSDRKRGN